MIMGFVKNFVDSFFNFLKISIFIVYQQIFLKTWLGGV